MYVTWLNSNSWLIEMGGQRILLDPWLVGPLVFGNLPWLFKGDCPNPRAIPDNIDLILLSQGLEDHAHPATLKQLNPSIPVVASPNAAKVAKEIGFSQVTALAHGETFTLADRVCLQATPGSPIGPLLTENGYWLKELNTGSTLYYEPHGYHSPSLIDLAPVDVVITPIVDLAIPLLGSIIQGNKSAVQVAKWLRPKVMLPTAAGGDVVFEGLLMSVLQTKGGADTLRAALQENNLITTVLEPKPGERLDLDLQAQVHNSVA
jgi:L-ascorbate metabolism protein UlaG (beta-lactamase superfamily)